METSLLSLCEVLKKLIDHKTQTIIHTEKTIPLKNIFFSFKTNLSYLNIKLKTVLILTINNIKIRS